MSNKQIIPLEETEQIRLVQYLHILKKQKKIINFFAPFNENKQSFANRRVATQIASKAKKMGKTEGVSDVFIITKEKLTVIELKRVEKVLKSGKLSNAHSKPTDKQLEFIDNINSTDYGAGYVAYGFQDAKEIILREIGE